MTVIYKRKMGGLQEHERQLCSPPYIPHSSHATAYCESQEGEACENISVSLVLFRNWKMTCIQSFSSIDVPCFQASWNSGAQYVVWSNICSIDIKSIAIFHVNGLPGLLFPLRVNICVCVCIIQPVSTHLFFNMDEILQFSLAFLYKSVGSHRNPVAYTVP